MVALALLYPQLPMAKIVGSDIAHAVPLTLVAGLGHGPWARSIGTSSCPAGRLAARIFIGSYFVVRIPERALKLILAATLFVVASKIAYDHITTASSIFTAFTRRAGA